MKETVIISLAIIALAAFGIIATGNPAFALVLLVIPPLPYALEQDRLRLDAMRGGLDDEDEDDSQPMGFTQELRR